MLLILFVCAFGLPSYVYLSVYLIVPSKGRIALYWVFAKDSIVTAAGTIMTKWRRRKKYIHFWNIDVILLFKNIFFVLLVFPYMFICLFILMSRVKVPRPILGLCYRLHSHGCRNNYDKMKKKKKIHTFLKYRCHTAF